MAIQDTDLLLVNRDDETYTATVAEYKSSFSGEITESPTVTASSEYTPSTLTATEATVLRASKDVTYNNWYKNGSAITGTQSTLVYTATEAGIYKYEERWVDNNGNELFPSAQVSVSAPTIATPTIISPSAGAEVDYQSVVFTASVPTAANGTINSWNTAYWILTKVSDGSNYAATKAIVPNQNQTLSANEITGLEAGESYSIAVVYSANDAGVAGATSPSVSFTTALPTGWFLSTALSNGANFANIEYGNGAFIVTRADNEPYCYISTDGGQTWPSSFIGSKKYAANISEGNGRWVFEGRLYSDDNGSTWSVCNHTPALSSSYPYLTATKYANGKWMGFAKNGAPNAWIYTSTDGISWTAINTNTLEQNSVGSRQNEWRAIAYGGGYWIAMSTYTGTQTNAYNHLISSDNGNSWSVGPPSMGPPTTASITETIQDCTYFNGRFIIAGFTQSLPYQAFIRYSQGPPTSNTWQKQTFSTLINDSIYQQFSGFAINDAGTQIVTAISGQGGQEKNNVLWSTDGVNWNGSDAHPGGWYAGCAYGDGKYITTGQNVGLMYSFDGRGDPWTGTRYNTNTFEVIGNTEIENYYGVDPDSDASADLGFAELTEQPDYQVAGYELQADGRYKPIRSYQLEVDRLTTAIAEAQAELDSLENP